MMQVHVLKYVPPNNKMTLIALLFKKKGRDESTLPPSVWIQPANLTSLGVHCKKFWLGTFVFVLAVESVEQSKGDMKILDRRALLVQGPPEALSTRSNVLFFFFIRLIMSVSKHS